MFDSVKDSGQRRSFATGSVRDIREGKGRFDLLSPIALTRLAIHTENGAKKYGDRNWEKGQPLSCYLDSALRHINKFREGHRDEDHMAAAMWNIAAFIHTEEMVNRGRLPRELNDMVDYVGPTLPLKLSSPEPPVDPDAWRETIVVSMKANGRWDGETPCRTYYLSTHTPPQWNDSGAEPPSLRDSMGMFSSREKVLEALAKAPRPPMPPADGHQLLLTTSDGKPIS